jgi:hypothetical protein
MRTNRLGCLSVSGLLASLLTLLAIFAISAARGGALFSPGELNAQPGTNSRGGVRSHAELQGRCSACHPAFWEPERLAGHCLECHTEILGDGQDFHWVMLAQSQRSSCTPCHTDHLGPQASLTRMELANFPHEELGFSLAAHRAHENGEAFTCSDCHTERITRLDPAACLHCHEILEPAYMTAHTADFGAECTACHDGIDTYGGGFDHNRLAFGLVGAHAAAGCGECHPGSRTIADLRQAPQDCAGCHQQQDAHAGRFGRDCNACHTPENWEEAIFDHSRTAFPLTGAHQQVDCSACHREASFVDTPSDCAGCHQQQDAHAGRFGQDCGACHTPENWEEAIFDHSRTAFPLTGAHQQVDCSACHREGVYENTPTGCAGCHADPPFHAGLFGQECADCHTTESWSSARFEGAHLFPMDHGDEGAVECRVCHPQALSAYTCYACHEHSQAEVEEKHLEEGIRNFQDCTRCHGTGQKEEGESEGEED